MKCLIIINQIKKKKKEVIEEFVPEEVFTVEAVKPHSGRILAMHQNYLNTLFSDSSRVSGSSDEDSAPAPTGPQGPP